MAVSSNSTSVSKIDDWSGSKLSRRAALCMTGAALPALVSASSTATTPTEIETLYAEWRAVRDRPYQLLETDAEAEAGYAEYRRLQIAIVESGLEPTSARDLALQYAVDTDLFGSESSDHFEGVVSRLLEGKVRGGVVS